MVNASMLYMVYNSMVVSFQDKTFVNICAATKCKIHGQQHDGKQKLRKTKSDCMIAVKVLTKATVTDLHILTLKPMAEIA